MLSVNENITEKYKTATFGAGCFWCVEAIFGLLKGVIHVKSGYTGGHTPNPTYEEVCDGVTGHAEVVQITYDPNVISFENLLAVFWNIHNPTTLNQQGIDYGTQYRSAIFYHNDYQRKAALKSKQFLRISDFMAPQVRYRNIQIRCFLPSGVLPRQFLFAEYGGILL
ncbi:Peptide methionine sulfoxide reductase MsrA [Capnocytophaga canimorsus]|nr:Peptide methionine sulfoxide reductase MsrA [Capnocytophaga canimorsus]